MNNIIKKEETTLQTFKTDDGLEIIIDTKTGESFASIKGYSRIGNISPAGIRKRLKSSGNYSEDKQAEILTNNGLRLGYLITEDLIAEWLPKDNPKMATAFMKLGIRMYMHTIAGFEKKDNITKADLAAMRQDIINEIRSSTAPLNVLDSVVKNAASNMLEKIKELKSLQPRANQILSVIPTGYLSYSEFKEVHRYAFKRGAWPLVEKNLASNKIIQKSPLNSIKYYDEQEVITTINHLNVTGSIKVEYGTTGKASIATVSIK